jgi:hypothetical protein
MQLSGKFGTLEVHNGILCTNNWSCFIIPYSEGHCDAKISLAPGYAIETVDEKCYSVVKK